MMANMLFLTTAIVMALAVAGVLVWAVVRKPSDVPRDNVADANAAVYRSQIADLDAAYRNRLISEQEWHQSRDEMSVRLLEDTDDASAADQPADRVTRAPAWGVAVSVLVAVPIASLALYLSLGTPDALAPAPEVAANSPQQELVKMADGLAQRLATEPDNVQGWVMLGRTYRTLGQYSAALQAYDRATRLDTGDDLKLERAEVLAASNEGSFEGEPWRVIKAILQAQPQHIGALLLAGSAAYADQQLPDALAYWQQARARMTNEHPDVPALESAIAEVQQQLGVAPAAAASDGASTLTGQVSLAATLQSAASPSDTVFVYAVQVNGPRMPVAIVRTTVSQLPMAFTLDDRTAMNPAFKLSTLKEVVVKARISKSGGAMPQPGDLIGSLGPVAVGTTGLDITISERMP